MVLEHFQWLLIHLFDISLYHSFRMFRYSVYIRNTFSYSTFFGQLKSYVVRGDLWLRHLKQRHFHITELAFDFLNCWQLSSFLEQLEPGINILSWIKHASSVSLIKNIFVWFISPFLWNLIIVRVSVVSTDVTIAIYFVSKIIHCDRIKAYIKLKM